VDWGGLVAGRAAPQALRRWRLMLKCVPNNRGMELAELVSYLVDHYCPKLRPREGRQQQSEGE
jgi:hypothetical protein